MMFKTCVFAALASAVAAQLPSIDPAQQSALLALATALPPSILAQAATNQAGFASEIASSIAAGNTPDWYQALPTDVKSALASIYPVQTPAETTPAETSTPALSSSEAPSSSAEAVTTSVTVITAAPTVVVPIVTAPSGTGASGIGSNGTAISTVVTPTLSSTGGGETGSSPQPTEAPGAASLPSAAIGAGIAGAIAFIAILDFGWSIHVFWMKVPSCLPLCHAAVPTESRDPHPLANPASRSLTQDHFLDLGLSEVGHTFLIWPFFGPDSHRAYICQSAYVVHGTLIGDPALGKSQEIQSTPSSCRSSLVKMESATFTTARRVSGFGT
ncbi:hypothetical protein BU23DRAFT_570858 [Bimuria novae-zelandiae CBS 107.79]|uniref:Uncharacterized protein n=1 Tax=Bimuria novae-zelandiae CBS 107.79 TaxID=1447943 RepID=A0A6A5UZ30_9PLEO|nr:hypothetical protein BU23DRAFT_570858 [Bimuria novae-zelandiae CBS 107.79]